MGLQSVQFSFSQPIGEKVGGISFRLLTLKKSTNTSVFLCFLITVEAWDDANSAMFVSSEGGLILKMVSLFTQGFPYKCCVVIGLFKIEY